MDVDAAVTRVLLNLVLVLVPVSARECECECVRVRVRVLFKQHVANARLWL